MALNAGPWIDAATTPGTGIYFRSDNVLGQPGYIGSAYRDLMFVRADGNVGIGTTAPDSLLEVVSKLQPTTNNPTQYALHTYGGMNAANGGGGNVWLGGAADFSFDGGSDSNFGFYNMGQSNGATIFDWYDTTNNTSNITLFISNAGAVGVDTATPQGNLDVEPTATQAASTTPANICLNGNCVTHLPKATWPTLATLYNYHTTCNLAADGSNLPTLFPFCNTACKRYCSGGCQVSPGSGCNANLPGLGYVGGVLSEVNVASGATECDCF